MCSYDLILVGELHVDCVAVYSLHSSRGFRFNLLQNAYFGQVVIVALYLILGV